MAIANYPSSVFVLHFTAAHFGVGPKVVGALWQHGCSLFWHSDIRKPSRSTHICHHLPKTNAFIPRKSCLSPTRILGAPANACCIARPFTQFTHHQHRENRKDLLATRSPARSRQRISKLWPGNFSCHPVGWAMYDAICLRMSTGFAC